MSDQISKTSVYEKYLNLSKTMQDKLLLIKIGEFYEIFGENAEIISKKIGITLTSKGSCNGEKIPMCGFPTKSKNTYFRKLLDLNYKIAITNIENISESSKLKAKELIRFITPGTVMEEDLINNSDSRCITFIENDKELKKSYILSIDITVGNIEIQSFELNFSRINAVLSSIDPKEIIVTNQEIFEKIDRNFQERTTILDNIESQSKFDKISLITSISENLFFDYKNFNESEINAIFHLLRYLKSIQGSQGIIIKKINSINLDDYCEISESSFYGLEIFKDFLGNTKNTLFNFLNQTKTPMGSRMMRRLITRPETSAHIINQRLDVVEHALKNEHKLKEIRENLAEIGDVERSILRFGNNIGAKLEIQKIKPGFTGTEKLFQTLKDFQNLEIIAKTCQKIRLILPVIENFNGIFLDQETKESDDVFSVKQIINPENNPTIKSFLFHLESIKSETDGYFTEFNEKYKIKSKISFDSVRGLYFIINPKEIENITENIEKISISKDKIRIKTEKINEIKEKLDLLIKKIRSTEEKIIAEEITNIKKNVGDILEAIESISMIDCLSAFAKISLDGKFSRPIIKEKSENIFIIKNGHHPLLTSSKKQVTTNDTNLDKQNKMIIITGPNMGGKSTFVKQNGIIGIMAQIGCFIPAETGEISIIDKIFTRVGAVDILKEGKSTFYMEMLDIKNIIENATENSLCLLDEICIGTSQKEGYIILLEILKYLSSKTKSKSILATHYHEIQDDISLFENTKHLAISSTLEEGKIVFDYKLKSIKTDSSYPLNVIKMLNFPIEIQNKIEEKLIDKQIKFC